MRIGRKGAVEGDGCDSGPVTGVTFFFGLGAVTLNWAEEQLELRYFRAFCENLGMTIARQRGQRDPIGLLPD